MQGFGDRMQPDSDSFEACFDVIVVGSGAAGAPLAANLVRGGLHVALIEAGPDAESLVNRVPALAFMASINPATNWNFETAPIPALNGRRQRWSQGRMVGGSSGINGMLWMRGSRSDYALWEGADCPGWGWEEALRDYREIEGSDRADAFHGQHGPLQIRRAALDLGLEAPFLEAMAEAGLPVVDDINADEAEGFGSFDVNIAGGRRCGVRRAWLQPLKDHPRLKLYPKATALHLVTREGRVTGLRLRQCGRELELRARHQVVLSCGAIMTPALLMRSGYGPGQELQRAGIAVRRDCPGIGANLHNHPAVALRYHLASPLSAARYLRPWPALVAALRYAIGRSGPLGESYVAMGGLFRSRGGDGNSDMMAVVMPALVKRAEVGARLPEIFEWRHGFALSVSLARQRSRGKVSLDPRNPFGPPVIDPGYFDAPEDMEAMVAGVLRLRCAIAGSAVLGLSTREAGPLADAEDASALEEAIRQSCGTFYHPGGTCRMGGHEAPVAPDLRLRGVPGLRIADASVVPLPMGATMQAPSMLIGHRAAQLILRDIARPSSGRCAETAFQGQDQEETANAGPQ